MTDPQRSSSLGYAHGLLGSDLPPSQVPKALALLLGWPRPLVDPACLLAYFQGVLAALDDRDLGLA